MKLDELIVSLQKLQTEGHGNLPVFYRHGSSGDCGEVGSAHVTNHTDDCGPFMEDFNLPEGSDYISLYVGH